MGTTMFGITRTPQEWRELVAVIRERVEAANSVYPLELTDEQVRLLVRTADTVESILPPE